MSMMEQISLSSNRVMIALTAGLEIELGRDAGQALAQRFLEAEDSGFTGTSGSKSADRWRRDKLVYRRGSIWPY